MGGLQHVIETMISTWYLSGGYFGIVLAMAVESCCVPLPSEIVMPLAGFYAVLYPERFSLPGVTLAGAAGCLIGSAVAYWVGRTGGRPLLLRYGRYILISQADSDRADRLFARHGGAVTFFSRLLPVVRTYISLPAGIAEMPFVRFCVYTVLGSLPWCLVLAWIGTKAGENVGTLSTVFHGLDVVILVLFLAAVAFYVWRHVHHDNVARAQHGANPTTHVSRRPTPIPSSRMDLPERPTLEMERVRPWPNRFARPHHSGQPMANDGANRDDAAGKR